MIYGVCCKSCESFGVFGARWDEHEIYKKIAKIRDLQKACKNSSCYYTTTFGNQLACEFRKAAAIKFSCTLNLGNYTCFSMWDMKENLQFFIWKKTVKTDTLTLLCFHHEIVLLIHSVNKFTSHTVKRVTVLLHVRYLYYQGRINSHLTEGVQTFPGKWIGAPPRSCLQEAAQCAHWF